MGPYSSGLPSDRQHRVQRRKSVAVGCRFGFGWRVGVGGGVPALFECSQESVFQFGGDVAVGFDDAVVEAVAESAALRDFGDVGRR
jgi:hypothetical protein